MGRSSVALFIDAFYAGSGTEKSKYIEVSFFITTKKKTRNLFLMCFSLDLLACYVLVNIISI
jgi:hypothetical protein